MCGRRPHCKRNLTFGLRSGASHVSGLFARHHDRWPDAVRGSGPNQSHGLLTSMTQKRVFPIDGSTVSYHAIITLAIRLSCSAVASRSRCQASSGGYSKFRRSIVSSFGHDRPSDARHLIGHRNGDELGWFLGQQPHNPGIFCGCCRACRTAAVAPMTSNRRR
jgi:hypothetical protein